MKDLQEDNQQLRDYIDKMVARIMEQNPAILEIPIQNRKGTKWLAARLRDLRDRLLRQTRIADRNVQDTQLQ